MAIEGATIVSKHVLDDAPLRASLLKNEALIRNSSAKMSQSLKIDTVAAQRGLHAVSLLLTTVGGQTTFLAIQAGYTIVAFAKLGATFLSASASAKMASTSMDALAAATVRAQIAGINLARTNAANAALTAGGATAAGFTTDAARASKIRELTAAAGGAGVGAAAAKPGLLVRAGGAALNLAKAHPGVAIAGAVASVAALAAGPVARVFFNWKEGIDDANNSLANTEARLKDIRLARESEHKFLQAEKEKQDKLDEATEKRRAAADESRLRNVKAFIVANREALAIEKERDDSAMRAIAAARVEKFNQQFDRTLGDRSLFHEAAIRFGGRKPSEFMEPGSMAYRLARFSELYDERRRAIEEAGGTSFGITTRDSHGFRFGSGAAGSVIGEQNEQKNTTEAIKHLEKEMAKLFSQFFGEGFTPQGTP